MRGRHRKLLAIHRGLLAGALAFFPIATALCQTGSPLVININTQTTLPLAPKLSGFNAPQLRNGVEYYDPKFLAAVAPLNPGWLRYPAGTASMDFDWNAGFTNLSWMNSLISDSPPLVSPNVTNNLSTAQILTQSKGGVFLSDFAAFANALGAGAIVCVNAFTDVNPMSTGLLALAAQDAGLSVIEWELANEPYNFPLIFPDSPSYATAMINPYLNDLLASAPAATVGLFYAGPFSATTVDFNSWDASLSAYTPQYWNAVSIHVYPITSAAANADSIKTLNGILAHGTVDYINSYLSPLIGVNTPVFITELNCCTQAGYKLLGSIYNGIFLAEYIARLSTVPNVKAVGINSLYTDNSDLHGLVQSVNDFESYLKSNVAANPSFTTNTATDPNTQYQFYMSAPGLAMQVANQAINGGAALWPTTVTGGPTVAILGYDGQPVPAVFAQAYMAPNGSHLLLITNKASKALRTKIEINGAGLVNSSLNVSYVSNTSPTAINTALVPNTVQIQTAISANPLTIQPYSVTCVTW